MDYEVTEPAESAMLRARAAAGLLVLDEADRVLLVVPSYKDYLDIPGGYLEHGETPRAAAREVTEEFGISPPVGRLLGADWWPDSPDGLGGPKVLFVFDGGRLTATEQAAIEVDGTEVTGFRFEPPDNLGNVTIPRLANRLRHAVAALDDGIPRYLEGGLVAG